MNRLRWWMPRSRTNTAGTATGGALNYDVEGRLTIWQQGWAISSYVYDGEGQRVDQFTLNGFTIYVGDLEAKNTSRGIATTHYHGGESW